MLFTKSAMRIVPVLLLLFLCLPLTDGGAYAEGRLVIKPYVEVGWERDTNFYKSDTNTRIVDDLYAKPGIGVGYTTEKSTVALDYYFKYHDYKDQDEDDIRPPDPSINDPGDPDANDFDYTEQFFSLKADTSPTERIKLGLNDHYHKSRDPANSDEHSNGTDRYQYSMNNFNPWVDYRFGEKFGLGLNYYYILTDYSEDAIGEGEDADQHKGQLSFVYYLNESTSFDIDYSHWVREYDKDSIGYKSNQVMMNVHHQFNVITLSAGAGYHIRDFDETLATSQEDIDDYVFNFALLAAYPKTNIKLGVKRNFNDSGAGDSYYTSTKFDATLTHMLFEKLTFTLKGGYRNADYKVNEREDDTWDGSVALDYLFWDFLSMGVEGGVEERDSNSAGSDYKTDYILVKAAFNYDFGSK